MKSETDDTETHEPRVIPKDDDEGKDVVGSNQRDIGMVTSVSGDTMYVDPNTSLTEQVRRKLEWGDKRRTDLPIPPEFIRRIDDEVILAIQRDKGVQEGVR